MSERLQVPNIPEHPSNPENPLNPIKRKLIGLQLWAKEVGEWVRLHAVDKVVVGARIAGGREVSKARENVDAVQHTFYKRMKAHEIDSFTDAELQTLKRTEEFKQKLEKYSGDPTLLFEEELNATEMDVNRNVEALVTTFAECDVHGRLRAAVAESTPLIKKLFGENATSPVPEHFAAILVGLKKLESWFTVSDINEFTPPPAADWTWQDMMASDDENLVSNPPSEVVSGRGEIEAPIADTVSTSALMKTYRDTAPKAANLAFRLTEAVQQLRLAVTNEQAALANDEKLYTKGHRIDAVSPIVKEALSVMANKDTRSEYADLQKGLIGLSEALGSFRRLMDTLGAAAGLGVDTYAEIEKARTHLMKLREIHLPIRSRREKIKAIRRQRAAVSKAPSKPRKTKKKAK